jgi:hypothetical protein
MAVISIPSQPPWIVARWAFELLADTTLANQSNETDKQVLRQAVALDGLHFDLLDAEQSERLACSLDEAASELQKRLLRQADSVPQDAELAEALAQLRVRLRAVSRP